MVCTTAIHGEGRFQNLEENLSELIYGLLVFEVSQGWLAHLIRHQGWDLGRAVRVREASSVKQHKP